MVKVPLLELRHITKTYPQGDHQALVVLKGCDLKLLPGEIVGVIGVSGSGKSSLLHIAGLLDQPTAGEVFFEGTSFKGQEDRVLTRWRNKKMGFIYQFHHLLPEFTALENVMMPLLMAGYSEAESKQKAIRYLGDLGLKERLTHFPSQLSGGEQQRVAVARALVNEPRLVLADEPTGNLDSATAHTVFQTFLALARDQGTSCLIATHDRALASQMDRVIALRDGHVVEDC